MSDTPTSLSGLFRSLGLTLTLRPLDDDEGSWACTLTRPDGAAYEIDAVSFFDVDPETGEEWTAEPTPSRILSVLAGGDLEDDETGPGDGEEAGDPDELAAEAADAVRAFLGDAAYALLLQLDAEEGG